MDTVNMLITRHLNEALQEIKPIIEQPVKPRDETLVNGARFRAFPEPLGEDAFTNVFDITYNPQSVHANIQVYDQPQSLYERMYDNREPYTVMASGGFFFLTDRHSAVPRQRSLNLAISNGQLHSLPVTDGEALLCQDNKLRASTIPALGVLTLDNTELTWAGSRTSHLADCHVYGNGNSVITHHPDANRGSIRKLEETSRFTPLIDWESDLVDVGFMRTGNTTFKGVWQSKGLLDIFAYNLVLRCPEKYITNDSPSLHMRTIGPVVIDSLSGAISVGPQFTDSALENHPINSDRSLGSKPPFISRRMARMALYETIAGDIHIRLYDGTLGSACFPGVTPQELLRSVKQEAEITWGCFLDPGKTSKLCIRTPQEIESHGNRDYILWPKMPDGEYVWQPQAGRPITSVIGLY
jgi:hypothetical protein